SPMIQQAAQYIAVWSEKLKQPDKQKPRRPQPTSPRGDNMKYWAVVCDTDAPRRPELGPEVDAAPKAYSAQDVSEKSFAPGRHGRGLRCGILARRFHNVPLLNHTC